MTVQDCQQPFKSSLLRSAAGPEETDDVLMCFCSLLTLKQLFASNRPRRAGSEDAINKEKRLERQLNLALLPSQSMNDVGYSPLIRGNSFCAVNLHRPSVKVVLKLLICPKVEIADDKHPERAWT